jgi:hypothetical protein
MSAAGPLPRRWHRSPQGGGCLISAAGPLPRRWHRSPQGGGCLISAAPGRPKQARTAARRAEVTQ